MTRFELYQWIRSEIEDIMTEEECYDNTAIEKIMGVIMEHMETDNGENYAR